MIPMIQKIRKLYDRNPVLFVIITYAVYAALFFIIDNLPRENPTILHSVIDDYIPFTRYALIFYVSWFPLLAIPMLYYVYRKDYDDLFHLILPLFTVMFASLLIYVFWYNGLDMRPEACTENDILAWGVNFIHSMDTPTNVCPSIHVSSTVIIDLSLQNAEIFRDSKYRIMKILIRLLDIAICASTMLLKQHSIIDVVAGLAFALLVYYVYDRAVFHKQAPSVK